MNNKKPIPAATSKKGFFWNMMGSGINAFATMFLTIVAARFVSTDACGIMGLAFGVAFIMQPFGTLETRAYQSTDINERFSYPQYVGMRFITCLIMFLITVGYTFIMQFPHDKASIIFAICMFKLIDSLSDVFQGMFQQHQHIEISGKALFIRILTVCICYTVTIAITHDPVISAWTAPLSSIVVVLLYDIPMAARFQKFSVSFKPKIMWLLLTAVFPLFASSFMNMYILNSTKLAIDSYYASLQNFWTPIITIASVVNLFSIFAIRPMLTPLAEKWSSDDLKGFSKTVRILLLWDIIITVVCFFGAWLLGVPVLKILYGMNLAHYKMPLLIVIAAGGLNAIATLFCYLFTIMRRQMFLLIGDGITFVLTLFLTPILVKHFELPGASYAYAISMGTRALCLGILAFAIYHKHKTALLLSD